MNGLKGNQKPQKEQNTKEFMGENIFKKVLVTI